MTEKQMISTLKGLTFGTVVGSKGEEALKMAISALEQEQDMTIAYLMGKYEDKEPCDDANREAVQMAMALDNISDIAKEIKKKLPSVQPSITRDIEKSNFSQEQYLLDTDAAYQIGYAQGKKDSSRKGHWIDVKDQMPESLQSVIVTWKNHEPEPYYSDIKHKPFVGVAIYYRDKWWWWSAYTEDVLAEYGRSNEDEVDDAIEITAWMPLPEPYKDMRGDTE